MSRQARARPVLARSRDKWRKRLATLVAAIVIPALATAAEWPGTASQASAEAGPGPSRSALAAYAPFPSAGAIHSDIDDAMASFADGAVVPGPAARPFDAAGTALDRARAEQCLTMAVYYEAATESDAGQRAVAQVVLNRVAHPSYPNTVCGVVFQGSERTTGCQFTFTCDGSLARKPAAYWWDRARRVARAALAGAVYAPVGLATHYHTLDVHPAWDAALDHVITIGAHTFFRWRGAAGQRAAFHAVYLGHEPTAGPHPRLATPPGAVEEDPVALARAYEAAQPMPAQGDPSAATAIPASPAPVYSEAIRARGGDALFRADNLPAGGALSPQLQRSGQWLARP
jgi:hypothetical protein